MLRAHVISRRSGAGAVPAAMIGPTLGVYPAPWQAPACTNLRLFTYPRPTVAAINGHAYAGGLITALGCDHRIAAEGTLQFALNEVRIGIPMPAVYCYTIVLPSNLENICV